MPCQNALAINHLHCLIIRLCSNPAQMYRLSANASTLGTRQYNTLVQIQHIRDNAFG